MSGVAVVEVLHPTVTRYGIGDTLYSVAKARRGVMERVVIKSIRVITNKKTLGATVVLYTDTLNGPWDEWDLVLLDEAVILVEQHRQKMPEERAKLNEC